MFLNSPDPKLHLQNCAASFPRQLLLPMSASVRVPSVPWTLLWSLLILAFGSGCDTLGLTEPPQVTIEAEISAPDKSQNSLAGCDITFDRADKVGSTTVNQCEKTKTYPQADATLTITGVADTYEPTKETVSLSADNTVTLNLSPDSVSITLEAKDAKSDTSVAGDWYLQGELIAKGEHTITRQLRKSNSPVSGRVEVPYFTDGSRKFSFRPDKNRDVTVDLERKTVKISVRPIDVDADTVLNTAETTIFATKNSEMREIVGEASVSLPQQSGQRRIETRLIGINPETGDKMRFDPVERTIAADADLDAEHRLDRLMACNDGIDNEIGRGPNESIDDRIDVYVDANNNGIADPGDTGDFGCTSPKDDHEGHSIVGLTTRMYNQDLSISSRKDNREEVLTDHSKATSLDESIQDAINGIATGVKNKREASEVEKFTIRINAGPRGELGNVNSSQVIPDSDTIDSWHTAMVYGVKPSFFSTGTYYTVTAVHANPSEDQLRDIIFVVDAPGNETRENGKIVFLWVVEEEDFDGFESSSAQKTGGEQVCQTNAGRKTCLKIYSDISEVF